LIRLTGVLPPGGFCFNDPITGKNYDSMDCTFDTRVKQIIHDRLANARLLTKGEQTDYNFVAQQVSEQNCQRLHNNRLFCTDGTEPQAAATPQKIGQVSSRTCVICGDALVEVLCATCSGRRLLAYRCIRCRKE